MVTAKLYIEGGGVTSRFEQSDRGIREAYAKGRISFELHRDSVGSRTQIVRSRLPASQGALGSSPGAVTEHHPHAGPCGGRAVGAEIMSAHIDYVPTFSGVEESNVGSCM